MQEIYISTDVEADGPIPGQNSMLSFGSAAYSKDKKLLSTFEVNLECLEGAVADERTAKWWTTQKEAWDYCRRDLKQPEQAMHDYVKWVESLAGKPVFVGYPVTYDFMFKPGICGLMPIILARVPGRPVRNITVYVLSYIHRPDGAAP